MFLKHFLYYFFKEKKSKSRLKEKSFVTAFAKFSIITAFLLLPRHVYADHDNIILSYQTSVEIEKDKLISEKTMSIQINRKQGDWIAEIEIPFGEGEKIDITDAHIISRGKIVRTLKKKDINTVSDISRDVFFENNFIQEFELKWHEYPYIINYSFKKTTDSFLNIANWHPIIYYNTPVLRAELEVKIPNDFPVLVSYTDSLNQIKSIEEGIKIYTWKSSYTNQIKSERYGVNILEKIPTVRIVPKTFFYGKEGSFDSWNAYGLWHYKIIEGLDELPDSEKKIIDQLLTGANDKKEKIKRIYNYLQDHTRYINVAIDEGGLIPYPASYVCNNKYGDCKALTIYMKALLNYVGIPSFYTLVYAGENPIPIDQSFPCHRFNHVILCVPTDQDTVWLENTSKYNPYNYLGTFTQNRYGLLVSKSGGKLIKTPSLQLEKVEEINRFDFYLDIEGAGKLTISKKLNGPQFENYKYYDEVLKDKDKLNMFRKDFPIKKIDNPEIQISQSDRNEPLLEITGSMGVRDQFKNLGKSIALIPPIVYTLPKETDGTKEHITRVNYPVNINDTLIYHIESVGDYSIKLPEDLEMSTEYGKIIQHFSAREEQIIVSRQFRLYAAEYPTTQYADFNSFMNLLEKAHQESVIILNPKQ